MHKDSAPKPGCDCAVCLWANRIIDTQQRLDADLAENYALYEAGLLVPESDRD